MTTLWPHAHPGAEQVQMDVLRRMPAWRKLELMAEMGEAVRALALAGIRQRHPDDSPAQHKRRLADLMLGPELAAQAYGPLLGDASAEDVILAKLEWYREANDLSELQWRDVLGMLEMQQGRLSRDYMLRTAAELGVSGLLNRALGEIE